MQPHLVMGFRNYGVSIHTVFLHCQVVSAATTSLVGTGHDSQPAALALGQIKKKMKNSHPAVGLVICSRAFVIVFLYFLRGQESDALILTVTLNWPNNSAYFQLSLPDR